VQNGNGDLRGEEASDDGGRSAASEGPRSKRVNQENRTQVIEPKMIPAK
jgi:hypothetical protein